MNFNEVVEKLERFTAPPKNGDYDQHTLEAMKAVYNVLKPKNFEEMRSRLMTDLNEYCQIEQKSEDMDDLINGSFQLAHSLTRGACLVVKGFGGEEGAQELLERVTDFLDHPDFLSEDPKVWRTMANEVSNEFS